DLQLLYSAYQKSAWRESGEAGSSLESLAEALGQQPASAGAIAESIFFFDAFSDFTARERRLLAAIGGAGANLTITAMLDPASRVITNPHLLPDDLDPLHRPTIAYRQLVFAFREANVPVARPILLTETRRFTTELRGVEQAWEK